MLRKIFLALAATLVLSLGFAVDAMAQTGGYGGDLSYGGGSAGGQIGGFGYAGRARVGDIYILRYHGHPGFDNGPPSCLINDPDNLRACAY
jgi:hypothetical protein